MANNLLATFKKYIYQNTLFSDDIKKTTETGTTKQVLADVIQAVVAPTTGDKGNPYYAKELDEAGESNY